jgi:hypothetical protein
MAGGLLNIISNGNNNIMLTGNPTKTFFKAVYSKYTNFGLQKFRIDYDGLRDLRLTEPSTFTFKVPRYAELLMDTYIVLTLPNIWSPVYHPNSDNLNHWAPYDFCWIRDLGTHIIKEIVITCGSQTIQKYSGEYLAAMIERDFSSEKKELINNMTGNILELYDPGNTYTRLNTYPSALYAINPDGTPNPNGAEPSIRGRNIYIPINTWFTMDSRCAFPLISLQYNELVISVTMRPIQELFQVRDVTDNENNFPYIQPDFNKPQFQMYRFLQTPPSVNLDSLNYQNKISTWNADIHLISTYCFLSKEESQLFAGQDQVYLIKDVFQYNFDNVAGSSRLKLTSSGMVANWMFYLQRNDVKLRNEWSNYTNWAYRTIPSDIIPAPHFIETEDWNSVGPYINPDGTNTGIYYTGTFNADNQKEILQTMGILFNGDYRENTLISGIYNYIEKYTRTQSFAKEGLYCYNFCLNTNPTEYQPSGAINMSKFKDIHLEITTYIPTVDPTNSIFQVICDGSGQLIGVNKQNWRLYEYNYNLTVFEERYNILSFIGGNCGMLLQR